MKTQIKGELAEKQAAQHVQKQGYKIIDKNYFSPYGEIDLIARKHNTLVFFEVRYRKNHQFGGALASVSRQKQQRIIKTAWHFLNERSDLTHLDGRFDVIAIHSKPDSQPEWIEAAFTL